MNVDGCSVQMNSSLNHISKNTITNCNHLINDRYCLYTSQIYKGVVNNSIIECSLKKIYSILEEIIIVFDNTDDKCIVEEASIYDGNGRCLEIIQKEYINLLYENNKKFIKLPFWFSGNDNDFPTMVLNPPPKLFIKFGYKGNITVYTQWKMCSPKTVKKILSSTLIYSMIRHDCYDRENTPYYKEVGGFLKFLSIFKHLPSELMNMVYNFYRKTDTVVSEIDLTTTFGNIISIQWYNENIFGNCMEDVLVDSTLYVYNDVYKFPKHFLYINRHESVSVKSVKMYGCSTYFTFLQPKMICNFEISNKVGMNTINFCRDDFRSSLLTKNITKIILSQTLKNGGGFRSKFIITHLNKLIISDGRLLLKHVDT